MTFNLIYAIIFYSLSIMITIYALIRCKKKNFKITQTYFFYFSSCIINVSWSNIWNKYLAENDKYTDMFYMDKNPYKALRGMKDLVKTRHFNEMPLATRFVRDMIVRTRENTPNLAKRYLGKKCIILRTIMSNGYVSYEVKFKDRKSTIIIEQKYLKFNGSSL
jgi:hypothetical protein